MHAIKALSDCSFPAERECHSRQELSSAINNPADGDKGWSVGSSDNAGLTHNLNLIVSFHAEKEPILGSGWGAQSRLCAAHSEMGLGDLYSEHFSELLSKIAAFMP